MSFLFSYLDWQIIHFTRWSDPLWLDWMHEHERGYALTTGAVELILCAPAVALKPLFVEAMKRVEASQEEQDAITHAPVMTYAGFYHLPARGESWTFVPWSAWALYWLVPSAIWIMVCRKEK